MEKSITIENAKKYIFDDLNNWCDKRYKETTDKRDALCGKNREGLINADEYERELAELNGEIHILCSLKMHIDSTEESFKKILKKAKVFDEVRATIEEEITQSLIKHEPVNETLVKLYCKFAGELPKENQS